MKHFCEYLAKHKNQNSKLALDKLSCTLFRSIEQIKQCAGAVCVMRMNVHTGLKGSVSRDVRPLFSHDFITAGPLTNS